MAESTAFQKRALMTGWINCRTILTDFMLNFRIDILKFFKKMRYGMGRRRETS